MGEERKTGKTHTASEGAEDKNKEKEEEGVKGQDSGQKRDGCVCVWGGGG